MIYATNNLGKITELSRWSPVPLESYQDYLKEPLEIDETGQTYEENATIKALTTARLLNQPVLGDDGGLELADFPNLLGIHTSRFFEPGLTDEEMNEQILKLYQPGKDYSRQAILTACLVYAYPDGQKKTVTCRMPFKIASTQKGSNGYGFDSILVIPELNQTVAQLSKEGAFRYSPRIQAFKQLLAELKG